MEGVAFYLGGDALLMNENTIRLFGPSIQRISNHLLLRFVPIFVPIGLLTSSLTFFLASVIVSLLSFIPFPMASTCDSVIS